MKIKKGDKVKLLRGKDAGKTGNVLEVSPQKEKVLVEGVNLGWRHIRPKKGGEKGQRIQKPVAMPVCAVALLCPKCGQACRVGHKILENNKKVRVCQKCKEIIE
ncbi:MAG: 50S ribosomal protein L24 [bacterium]|nr:50S ribosomal protein L24 [bacterium]